MSENIYLTKCGHVVAQKVKNEDYIICLVRILTVGEYTDMNGTKVIVDEDVLTKLATNYNKQLEKDFIKYKNLIKENSQELDWEIVSNAENLTIEEFDGLVNQIDHNTSTIEATVGNLVGKMQIRQSAGKLAIFANIKVKGKENVCCVADNRWRNVSLQYNPKTFECREISWIIWGADSDANKVMSYKLAATNEPVANPPEISSLLDEYNTTLHLLSRKILIDKNLLKLCKLRKITKADAYFIEKELHDVTDLISLNKIFNILDNQLNIPKSKEQFIPVNKKDIADLHNTLKAASYDTTYQQRPINRA